MFMALPLGSAGLLSLLVGRNGCGTLFLTPSAGGSGLLMEESSAASVTCLLSVSTGDSGTRATGATVSSSELSGHSGGGISVSSWSSGWSSGSRPAELRDEGSSSSPNTSSKSVYTSSMALHVTVPN